MKPLNVKVRWMIHRDMPEVLDIEQLCFQFPESEDDFIRLLRERSVIGMVAEEDRTEIIRGFMVYDLDRNGIDILNFAVQPAAQGKGVGTAMLNKLISKLHPQRRKRLTIKIRETNLDAQLWFSRRGFKATKIVANQFDHVDEDAYQFVYRAKVESAVTA